MFRYLWKLVNNGFFCLMFGAAITLLVVYIQRQDIKIGYTVVNTNVIAKGGIDSNITILFKGDSMPNLNIVEFAFWNNGTVYIDNKNISETIPLKISTENQVRILDYQIEKRSRDNLNFEIAKSVDGKISGLVLKIHGDDGLERFDGLKIKILYSGSEMTTWRIDGRVKGNLNTFKKYDFESLDKYRKQSIWWLFLWGAGIIISPFLIFYLIRALVQKKVHETKLDSVISMAFAFTVILIICIWKTWSYVFYAGALSWLLQ